MTLLNRSELAVALGRSPGYVSAMVKSGMQMPCGRISLKSALAWMADHPDFRMADAYPRRSVTPSAGQGRSPRKKSSQGRPHFQTA